MKMAVLGAGGGLGRNVVDAAVHAGHDVRAFVRPTFGGVFPAAVRRIDGDANKLDDVARALQGVDVAYFCLNPRFARWLTDFPPLLATALAAASAAGARLVFPGNVWIYGPGRAGDFVDETRAAAPTSRRGRLRAEMERTLRESACRHCIVRLPEFYGPGVVTLTAGVFRSALRGGWTFWPGALDVEVEFTFMPDAAQALLAVGAAAGVDGEVYHVPGSRTSPRAFIEAVYRTAGTQTRILRVPGLVLSLAGLFHATARAAADIAHLWTRPILLDGARYTNRFGAVPATPIAEGIMRTLAWHRGAPDLVLQG